MFLPDCEQLAIYVVGPTSSFDIYHRTEKTGESCFSRSNYQSAICREEFVFILWFSSLLYSSLLLLKLSPCWARTFLCLLPCRLQYSPHKNLSSYFQCFWIYSLWFACSSKHHPIKQWSAIILSLRRFVIPNVQCIYISSIIHIVHNKSHSQIMIIIFDIVFELTIEPLVLFPILGGFCCGWLCSIIPLPIVVVSCDRSKKSVIFIFVLSMKNIQSLFIILVCNIGVSIIICVIFRHQAILFDSSPFKLSKVWRRSSWMLKLSRRKREWGN